MATPEELRAKLARLRGDAPPPRDAAPGPALAPDVPSALSPTPAPPRCEPTPIPRLPEHVRRRLARGRPAAVPSTVAPAREGERTVGPPEALTLERGPAGHYAARTSEARVGDTHGAWRYEEAFDVDPDVFALLTGDESLAGVDLSRALYLDTETTGLEGGAGTYVFLVGLGWFEGARFVVQQSFLRGPEDEPALLSAVAERVAAAPAVVSFFGKVFDRHRLEDKMRVHGVTPPFAGRLHLDLCFPLRRLTKGALPDGRLQTMERNLVGLTRADDMPGSLAPAAWFDFLADRAHRLEGVFRHNLDDVRSLATLAAYLGRVTRESRCCGAPLPGPLLHRALALARAYDDRRDTERALAWYARIAGEGAPAVASGADAGPLALEPLALEPAALSKARAAVVRLERRLARRR